MDHTPEEEHVVYKAVKKSQKSSSSLENNAFFFNGDVRLSSKSLLGLS